MGFSVALPLVPRPARQPNAFATFASERSSHARVPPGSHEVAGMVTKPPRPPRARSLRDVSVLVTARR